MPQSVLGLCFLIYPDKMWQSYEKKTNGRPFGRDILVSPHRSLTHGLCPVAIGFRQRCRTGTESIPHTRMPRSTCGARRQSVRHKAVRRVVQLHATRRMELCCALCGIDRCEKLLPLQRLYGLRHVRQESTNGTVSLSDALRRGSYGASRTCSDRGKSGRQHLRPDSVSPCRPA